MDVARDILAFRPRPEGRPRRRPSADGPEPPAVAGRVGPRGTPPEEIIRRLRWRIRGHARAGNDRAAAAADAEMRRLLAARTGPDGAA